MFDRLAASTVSSRTSGKTQTIGNSIFYDVPPNRVLDETVWSFSRGIPALVCCCKNLEKLEKVYIRPDLWEKLTFHSFSSSLDLSALHSSFFFFFLGGGVCSLKESKQTIYNWTDSTVTIRNINSDQEGANQSTSIGPQSCLKYNKNKTQTNKWHTRNLNGNCNISCFIWQTIWFWTNVGSSIACCYVTKVQRQILLINSMSGIPMSCFDFSFVRYFYSFFSRRIYLVPFYFPKMIGVACYINWITNIQWTTGARRKDFNKDLSFKICQLKNNIQWN